MDDNGHPRRARVVHQFWEENHIERMDLWLGQSPDMNPTEAIWDHLGKAVNGNGTSRPGLVPDREVGKPSSAGDSTIIQHAPLMHCTDWQVW